MPRWSALVALIAGLTFLGCSEPEPTPLREARIHLSEGRWADVVTACDRVLSTNKDDPEALLMRGRAYLGLDQPKQAVHDLSALIRIRPEDAEGYHQRAMAYSQLHDVERAYIDRQRARELDITLKSAYPFEISTASPIDITAEGDSVAAQKSDNSFEEEELDTFPGYEAEPEDTFDNPSRELESFSPSARDVGRKRPGRRTYPSSSNRTNVVAEEGSQEGQQDLLHQWIIQHTTPPPRRANPPELEPPTTRPSPDVPLAEPSGPANPQITTALPIDLDGRPLVRGKPIGTPNVSLPTTNGVSTAPGGAGAAGFRGGMRNLRRPANASLGAGRFRGNPIYTPTHPIHANRLRHNGCGRGC